MVFVCLSTFSYTSSTPLKVNENVLFQTMNDVYIQEGRWLVATVHDLKPYKQLLDVVYKNLFRINSFITVIKNSYQGTRGHESFFSTFTSLSIEADVLNETITSIALSFGSFEYMGTGENLLSPQKSPHILMKRSVLPFVGEAMSFLFGTVSDKDLENINKNIDILASNQQEILHDLEFTMSVLNATRIEVSKNRRSIMSIIEIIMELDEKIDRLESILEKKLAWLEQFVHTVFQLQFLIDELKLSTQDLIIYLDNLKLEIDMLAVNRMSTGLIKPTDLRNILIEIESKIPNNFGIPVDPKLDIWHYYKTISCSAHFKDNQVRIVFEIPLIRTVDKFEVYKVINLPIAIPKDSIQDFSFTSKYGIDTEYFMISKNRVKYSLLNLLEFRQCANRHIPYCRVQSPFYRTSMSTSCIIALFTNNTDVRVNHCNNVVTDDILPRAEYIDRGMWVILTRDIMTFTVNCNNIHPYSVTINCPFGILKLNNTCKAFNEFFDIPEYYEKESFYTFQDPLESLLKIVDYSNFSNWNELHTNFPTLKTLEIPKELKNIKEIPITDFVHKIKLNHNLKSINKRVESISMGSIVFVGVIIVLIIIFCLRKKLSNVFKYCKEIRVIKRHTKPDNAKEMSPHEDILPDVEDAESDAEIDVNSDSEIDANLDAELDANLDAELDANLDAELGVLRDVLPDGQAEHTMRGVNVTVERSEASPAWRGGRGQRLREVLDQYRGHGIGRGEMLARAARIRRSNM